jgi:hypothetical protein
LFLLGLPVVLAATDSCNGGSNFVFCLSPGNTPIHSESVLGTSGLSLLTGLIGGASAKFHCKSDDFRATLGLLGLATGLIAFLNCKEELPTNCKLTAADEAEIHVLFHVQLRSATLALVTGTKGVNEEFASVHIEAGGGCAIPGTYIVKGKQLVEFPTGEAGKEVQEIVAKKSGSFLKLGNEAGSFSAAAKVHLGGANKGSAWLIMKGV